MYHCQDETGKLECQAVSAALAHTVPAARPDAHPEVVGVLIVLAALSYIGAAHHLRQRRRSQSMNLKDRVATAIARE